MTTSVTLRRWNRRAIALEAALDATFAALGDDATLIALCSTPSAWRFARVRAVLGRPTIDWGGLPDLALPTVFDLRAFLLNGASAFELRWRAEAPAGIAAWLTTSAAFDPTKLSAAPLPGIEVEAEIGSRRLLFGRAVLGGAPEGWVALREGRIGEIRVPHACPAEVLELRGTEYVAREARFGNAHVAEELLTGFAALSTEEMR